MMLLKNALDKVLNFSASLKLAVLVIAGFAFTLAYATFFEATYGTKAVQNQVYQSWWFALLLGLLGINIFSSAAVRYPWKRHQLGFLVAHIGILVILYGSFVTRYYGVDGSMPLYEGETGSLVSIDDPQFEVWNKTKNQWLTRKKFSISDFKKLEGKTLFEVEGVPFILERFFEKARAEKIFISSSQTQASAAIEVEVKGASTGIQSTQWLKVGDPDSSQAQMGLALLRIVSDTTSKTKTTEHTHSFIDSGANGIDFMINPEGKVRYILRSSKFGKSQGTLALNQTIETGWRDFQLTLKTVLPKAQATWRYNAADVNATNNDLPSAIQLSTPQFTDQKIWLGYGDSIDISTSKGDLLLRYGPKLLTIPFGIKLNHFKIGRYPGSEKAMEYSSQVTLLDPAKKLEATTTISMNEPLKHQGYTFYQASYQETPQGYISVLSVGKDPGRPAKYIGSILLVLGIIIMYTYKWFFSLQRKKEAVPLI